MRKQFNKLHLYFIPKRYWDDEQDLRKAKIIVNTVLLSAMFAFFYFFNTVFFQMENIRYNMIFCTIAFALLPFWFRAGASRVTIANAFSAIALFSTVYDIYFSSGLYSWSMAWLSLSPVLAVLLIDKRYGYLWLGLALLFGAIIGIMHMNGYQFPNEVKGSFLPVMTLNAVLGLIAIMFFVVLALDNAYNTSLVKLDQKNQQVEWERLKAEQERRRAQESEQAKQQFLANMSHEIRTPINAITGFTTLLLEKNPTDEQRKYLEIVEKSTDSLRIIINDILDLTKIEVGKMPIEKILFEPKDIVEFITNTLRPKAEAKKLELKLDYDVTIPAVLIGDPTRLNQILTNLLDNAIKFTENGSVLLKVEQAYPKIKFTVTDTGIGMTPEQIDIVFEPFSQAEMGTTRKYGGTGLGLHISKQLVELQNGILDVESIPGKGSKFSFAIEYPVSAETGTLRKRVAVSDEIIKDLTGVKILLAEDNEFNRIVAIETLQLKIPGVIIDTVNNGKEAIEKFTNHDIIIMDVQMPVMDGYEATRRIRSDASPLRNQVPIVALTASIIQTDINKCFAAGMNGFVPKPFNTNELLLALHDAWKKKQAIPLIKPEKVVNANGNVTDLTFLKESCGDDAERIKKYIGMYLKQASSIIEALNKALKEKDYDTIKSTVHPFKVQLKYMGMHEAEQIAKNIELACIEQPVKAENLPVMVNALNDFYNRSVKELTNN